MQHKHVKDFQIPLEELSEEDRLVSDLLLEASAGVAPIYSLQENDRYDGANLYPHDATKEEIETASRENPSLFSEYTLLIRNNEGRLVTAPYHLQYRTLLEPVALALQRASEVAGNREFGRYLSLRAASLLDGDYEKSESVWLAMEEPVVDIVIGPYDRYIDKLFSKKYAYQAWTGILDAAETERAQEFVDAFLDAYEWQGSPIKARVDKTRRFAGLAAVAGWSANNLPCQLDWREKYGSKITIFHPSFHQRFADRLPDLHAVWPESKGLGDDYLERVSRMFIFAHESSHPLVRRHGDEERLKSAYSTISELYCDVLGISTARKLIGKVLTQEEWELLVPTFFSWALNRYKHSVPSAISAYLQGEAVALNFLLDAKAVDIENGRLKIRSYDRVETSLTGLIDNLEYLMSEGREQSAQQFIHRFDHVEKFGLFTLIL